MDTIIHSRVHKSPPKQPTLNYLITVKTVLTFHFNIILPLYFGLLTDLSFEVSRLKWTGGPTGVHCLSDFNVLCPVS